MPRMSFSLRSPPPPPKRPTPDADAVPVFTGDVWVPATPSYLSFGFGAKWAKATLTMWLARVVDDAAAPRPMLHLQLGDRAAVVATSVYQHDPRLTVDVPPGGKKPVHIDVKAVEDVRRAMLYHTAAARATLAFYVDTDVARDHLVHLIQEVLAATAASPPSCAPAGSPTRPHAALVRPPSPPVSTAPAPSAAVDQAFAMLENARAMQQRGHVVDALTAYVAADHALAAVAAQPHVGADAAAQRTRILNARREIRAASEVLEMEKALPRAAVAVAATTVDVSEPPPPPATTTPAQHSTSSPAAIDTRLGDLQTFAHARNVDRAQRERRVDKDDLSLRLHALRNAKPTAPSLESLQQRLERLRGNGGGSATPPSPPPIPPPSVLSPVDLIVQQAMDEVAMGIVDDADGVNDGLCSTSSSLSHSSDSSSGTDDDVEHRRHRGRSDRDQGRGRGHP